MSDKEKDKDRFSRRDFMKKAGLGAAGLGAASIVPGATGLNIESNNPLNYNENFSVDGQGNIDTQSLDTDDAIINNSITWPDGTTTTSSPSSGSSSYRNVPAGIVYKDGDYIVAESFVTGEKWRKKFDTGAVLQSLVDALVEARNGDQNIGEIKFGAGYFPFETPVELTDHRGTTITGQSFRQGNSQSGTQLVPNQGRGDKFPAGRGLLEMGNIGDKQSTGDGEATHIRNVHIELRGQDAVGIYNWGQDRLRLTDVKSRDNGPNGAGLVLAGGYNCTLTDSYFDNAAILMAKEVKNTNSLRIHNCTFNTTDGELAPITLFAKGCRFTTSIINGHDTSGTVTTNAVMSSDTNSVGFYDADSRVEESDFRAQLNKINMSSCRFVTGGDDVKCMQGVRNSQFSSCRFSSSGAAVVNPSDTTFSSCLFAGVGKECIKFEGPSSSPVAITGCAFDNFGNDNLEPAISVRGSAHLAISGCSFRSRNDNDYDIVLDKDSTGVTVVGNKLNAGIKAPINSPAKTGEPRKQTNLVVNNNINPIGFTRPTPSLPSGTGSSNSVTNSNPQGAWVYHDGSGVKVTAFGTERSYSINPNPVFVPRGSSIYFENSTPSAWDWWWH